MKNNPFKILLLVAAICSFSQARAEEDEKETNLFRLDRDKIKAFWILPLSSRVSADVSWIEILKCSDPASEASCTEVVRRVPVSQILSKGTLSLDLTESAAIKLIYKDPVFDDKPMVLASQSRVQNWFPRVELCTNRVVRAECQYSLDLNPNSSSVFLNVYFAK